MSGALLDMIYKADKIFGLGALPWLLKGVNRKIPLYRFAYFDFERVIRDWWLL